MNETVISKYCSKTIAVCTIIYLLFGVMMNSGYLVSAQTGNVVAGLSPSDSTPDIGDIITVVVNIDMTEVDPPDNALGSYTATLTWNPEVLSYITHSGAPPPGFSGIVNVNDAASGSISFNGANATGTTGNVLVLMITFDVIGGGFALLDLEFSAMAAASTFTDLLPLLTINEGSVQTGVYFLPLIMKQ